MSFKPMVKMMTTEPSVILKLKKGGKVAKKMDGGYMPMQSTMPAQAMPARGGLPPAASPMAPSMMARRRAMMAKPAMNPTMMKKGGKADMHEDAAQDRAMIKKAMSGKKFADGGGVTASMAKTTIKGNAGKFLNTDVETAQNGSKSKAGTGNVKMGNGGGYANGGTISGNAGKFLNTKVVDGDKNDKASGTGDVKMGNRGGFKKGGKVPGLGNAIQGGNWENRAADTAKPGVSNATTGGVKNGNGGGFKKGGSTKKAYATGGTVDTGKPVAMPKKHLSQPVANSLQSGTFKKGGKVSRYRDGDSVEVDPTPSNSINMRRARGGNVKKYESGSSVIPAGDPKVITDKASKELEEALNPLGMIKEGYQKVRDYFSNKPAPAGSVTKTEKSVTVTPKKRGGRA